MANPAKPGRTTPKGTKPAPARRLATIEELTLEKRPITQDVPVVLDPQRADRLAEVRRTRDIAEAKLRVERGRDTPDPRYLSEYEKAEAEFEAALAAAEDAMRSIRVRSVGRRRWEEMIDRCAPSEEAVAEAKAKGETVPNVDQEKHAPMVIAACALEPQISLAEAAAIWDSDAWSQGELVNLYVTCQVINQQPPQINLGKGPGGMRN